MKRKRHIASVVFFVVTASIALLWSVPFIWMVVASFRPQSFGALDMASLWPDFSPTLDSFRLAWESADFATYYVNTLIVVVGTLVVQLVTVTLAASAFARLTFQLKDAFFYL